MLKFNPFLYKRTLHHVPSNEHELYVAEEIWKKRMIALIHTIGFISYFFVIDELITNRTYFHWALIIYVISIGPLFIYSIKFEVCPKCCNRFYVDGYLHLRFGLRSKCVHCGFSTKKKDINKEKETINIRVC